MSIAKLLDFEYSKNLKILSVLGDDPVDPGLMKRGGQLGVQKAFPSQTVFPYPPKTKMNGFGSGNHLPYFLGAPPRLGPGDRLFHGQGPLKTAWIRHHMQKFHQHLGHQGKARIPVSAGLADNLPSPAVDGNFGQLMSKQEGGINPEHQKNPPKDLRGFSMALKYSPRGRAHSEQPNAFLGFFYLCTGP